MTLQLKLKQLDPELKAIFEIRPPIRLKIFVIKRYHRKRLLELFLKSLGQVPQLQELIKNGSIEELAVLLIAGRCGMHK